MSGATSPHAGMTRRNFLKTAGVAAGALGLAGAASMTTTNNWLAPAEAHAEAEDQVIYTFHQTNCGNRCSLKCTVRDGRMANIESNTWEEDQYSICCLKGLSEIQRIYSPDRIQTPLKRVGERGEGKFESISWEEAFDTVAQKLQESVDKYGGSSILFPYSSGLVYEMPLLRKLLGAQAICESGIDMAQGNGLDQTTGDATMGKGPYEVTDWVNTKTLIMVGVNLLESGMTDARFMFDAQEAGCNVTVVDPIFTSTASKADTWVPIEPGTDAALYLGMVSAILDNEWYDEEYIKAHTSCPFLVSTADGSMLKETSTAEDGTETATHYVWDGSRARLMDEVADPILEGTFEVDGVECTTVFSLLKENQKNYTTAWASEVTTIPEDQIIELARKYAQETPSFLLIGYGGNDKYSNADIAGHAMSLLPSLTGNIGKPGCGAGVRGNHYGCHSLTAKLGAWALPAEFVETPLEMQTPLMRTNPSSVHTVFNLGNTFVQHLGNYNTTKEWLKTLDFIVTSDIYYCDSVAWSDIVLPVCTGFETRDECGMIQVSKNHILLQMKVLDPLFESKTDFEIEHELCGRLGFGEYMPESTVDYVKAQLTTDDQAFKNVTYEKLKENNSIMRLDYPDGPYVGHTDQVYKTKSGRLEIYHEGMLGYNQELPNYESPIEAYADNPLKEKYPLQFVQARRRYRVHTQWWNSEWVNQIVPYPTLEINPTDAEARGLQSGDTVRIFNDRGEFSVTCLINNAARPGQVYMCEGTWCRDTGGASYQDVTNDTLIERGKVLPYGANIPMYDTLVQVEKA
ncbi:dehydrogenase [Slackia equolifaciens]|uniref:Dehydrogenase n=1 Tax=Slackia equolifaciens TaxID=498718 RepID=A0A3N0B5K2_9ACTN|nr:molybdopterin-dependent oxidoreductase [Slackia equolifaciens]RNL42170.1 dehydrogenase [Slackia equolifaciens]